MCGIAGIIGPGSRSEQLLKQIGDRLAHRGPDDHGIWADPTLPIGFSHRRLAIVDLSAAGHQPMLSGDGRWAICYNGEIYNHQDLRRSLDPDNAQPWRGHSDTETLVEAVAAWGLERTLKALVGMFAFALLDRKEGRLFLARDRFGEKPLYYGHAGRDILFASELKSFHVHPDFDTTIDLSAVDALVSHAYIGSPKSIFRSVRKLPPGHVLELDVGKGWHELAEPYAYWSYEQVVGSGLKSPFGTRQEAIEQVDAALRSAIAGQSVADVPVGTFLSGGIDSSLITAIYQQLNPGKVKTYTIGFDEAGYDESADAKKVAAHIGTLHRELRVSSADAQSVIPKIPEMFDEPFADSSQIPTYLVSQLARSEVTVALSGDAGDELFGGYNRHVRLPRLWSMMTAVPRPIRKPMGAIASRIPPSLWDKLFGLVRGANGADHVGTKIAKFSKLATSLDHPDQLVESFLDEWSGDQSPLIAPVKRGSIGLPLGSDAPLATRLMLADASTYLPDDILCKVDRAAMACSLETRVPFLDHRLAEVAARIPVSMNIRGSTGKSILRDLLANYVPRELIERPKAGFAIPIGRWLRGDLCDWAEHLLDEKTLRADGIFDAAVVRKRWETHLSGQSDASQAIWTILMFQSWKEHWKIS